MSYDPGRDCPACGRIGSLENRAGQPWVVQCEQCDYTWIDPTALRKSVEESIEQARIEAWRSGYEAAVEQMRIGARMHFLAEARRHLAVGAEILENTRGDAERLWRAKLPG
jgi:hypothetical protein